MRAAMLTQSQRPLAPRAGRVKSGRRPAASRAAAGDYDGYEIRERRLRYPDGYERVLRYAGNACARNSGPRIDGSVKFVSSSLAQWTGEAATASWMDPDVDPQELGASAAGRSAAASKQQQRQQDEDSATSTSTSSSFPDSPAALARMLNSTAFRAAREAREELVKSSYTIHRSSPYGDKKATLFVLATYHEDKPADMFTLRTKVIREGAAEALGLPPGFAVQEIIDGVLAFESEDDAERYAVLLEADGHKNLLIADSPANALFDLTSSCSAVVVLFRQGSQAPMPLELMQALKGAVSLE